MSLTGETFMGSDHHEMQGQSCFGLAVAQELRRIHPANTAKMVARALSAPGHDCSVKTAENILSGHLSAKSITRLIRAYGLGLLIDAAGAITGETLRDFIVAQAEQARLDHVRAKEREHELSALVDRVSVAAAERRGFHRGDS